MKSTRPWWFAFAGCAAFVLIAMAGISVLVLAMERIAFTMDADADRNAEMRAALWDMESWLIAHVGRESSRPYLEYQPYFPTENVYTRYYSEITPGDVFAPSPLLTFESDYFPIHFEINEQNKISSPQVPQGNALDLAQATLLPDGWIDCKDLELKRVAEIVDYDKAALACSILSSPPPAPEPQTLVLGANLWSQQVDQSQSEEVQQARGEQGFNRRTEARQRAQEVMDKDSYSNAAQQKSAQVGVVSSVQTGPFVATWIKSAHEGSAADSLVFFRRVAVEDEVFYQGFLCDWEEIRAALIAQVSDTFPTVEILPIDDDDSEAAHDNMFRLASIPAVVRTTEQVEAGKATIVTPARATLGVAWLFVLLAIAAAAITLRSTIDFANRRSRFASAVTHELRTPLTTFQMYSEMLAEGMVSDSSQQQVYHETLREESTRLSAIVENVLAYARIEDGRTPRNIQRVEVGRLFDRFRSAWQRRVEKSGASLTIIINGLKDVEISTDPDTLEQILTNLIDNACKYGCADGTTDKQIEVIARREAGRLRITVRDYGPGIAGPVAKRIFEPFERGTLEPGVNTPGVGLGLALSRELAATIGGTLVHHRPETGAGACFELSLPMIGAESG